MRMIQLLRYNRAIDRPYRGLEHDCEFKSSIQYPITT